MIVPILFAQPQKGYISSSDDPEAKVTVGDGVTPARRDVYLLDSKTLAVIQRSASLSNGHYLLTGLDPNKRYLVMARDLPPNGIDQRFEPATWDYVEPATDLTIAEQRAMWQTWADEVYQQQLAQG